LTSLLESTHSDWELVFIDDGSQTPGEPIVRELLADHLDKVKFVNTEDSKEQKIAQGGSRIGQYMNEAMVQSSADLAIMVCDDDAVLPHYFKDLSEYFTEKEEQMYAFSHVVCFNPEQEAPSPNCVDSLPQSDAFYNKLGIINPYCAVDSSQVAWRIRPVVDKEIRFPSPQTVDLDATFYAQLFNHFGGCPFTGFYAQYKGVHVDQLTNRKFHQHEVYENKLK